MRKANAVLSALIMVLFLIHGIEGSFQLMGFRASSNGMKALAWGLLALICLHTLIGIKLTWDSIKICKKTGVSYFKENKLFWARRLSGFAIMILIAFHVFAFGETVNGVYRLQWFTAFKLATQILLLLTVALHVLMNVRPLLIGLGIPSLKERVPDIWIWLSVLLVFMSVAFIVYYLRWNLI